MGPKLSILSFSAALKQIRSIASLISFPNFQYSFKQINSSCTRSLKTIFPFAVMHDSLEVLKEFFLSSTHLVLPAVYLYFPKHWIKSGYHPRSPHSRPATDEYDIGSQDFASSNKE